MRRVRTVLWFVWICILRSGALISICAAAAAAPLSFPRLHDQRLELKLFASDPDIVTPIGMAIDARDRIFVIESHTHTPPKDYAGPKSDRIKVFVDADGDGQPENVSVFADGLNAAMNVAFSPEGELFVVCAREVWVLHDQDDDGASDSRVRILQLQTSNTYPHSALLGLAFGPDGWLYVSRGNNGSALYTCVGSDGSRVSGYGDGGNVMRCRPDGSQLEEFATGFWNPFDLKFDARGRLLCVDNDPDARGPNRFVHVVQHGDYGYKSFYGGGGNHPFQAWEGELPGTLPMIDGTGEAPSGLLDCAHAALPEDYRDNYLITIWNENTITRHAVRPKGVSLTATNSVLVSGAQDFRPVALAADSRGNTYFTDWVLVAYPNHGRGRVWRLAVKPGQKLATPRPASAKLLPNPAFAPFEALVAADSPRDFEKLEQALRSDDAFLRHAAVVALTRPAFRERVLAATKSADQRSRLGALLALRLADRVVDQRGQQAQTAASVDAVPTVRDATEVVRRFLQDPDPQIRRLALIWAGEAAMSELRDDLEAAIAGDHISASLFETYLAAVECVQPDFVRAYRARARDKANQLPRKLPSGLVEAIVRDEQRPVAVRALALTRIENPREDSTRDLLVQLARSGDPLLQREAIRTLARSSGEEIIQTLQSLALDAAHAPEVRAETLAALAWQHDVAVEDFLSLLNDRFPLVQSETVRLLRPATRQPRVREALLAKWKLAREQNEQTALVEQLEFALFPPGTDGAERAPARPDSLETWQRALAAGGDRVAGERLFFSAQTSCSQCHRIHNRGGRIGPDLSNLGQSVSRPQIIHSILRPSDQFPPQWQAWFVETKDDELHQGLQLDHKDHGDIELFTTAGETARFKAKEIASYGVLQSSLMPDGLEQAMTVSELRDLVAFLESLK